MRHHTNPLLVFAVALLVVPPGGAQPRPSEAKPLDATFLRDYAITRGFTLSRPVKPKFTPDNKAVLFLRSPARSPRLSLYEFNLATTKTRELLTPDQVLKGGEENLSPEEKARRERMRLSAAGFTDFQFSEDGKQVLLPLGGKLFLYDRSGAKARELKTGKGTLLDPKFSPDGTRVAYVLNHDLHVYDLATDKESAVTKGGTEKKPHGLAEFIAQEEMYRYTGYWWSPDSKSLAYQETDHEGVEIWHVADATHPEQAPSPQYYPRPGKANVKVRLGIVPASGGETVWLDWKDRDKFEYLAQVRWEKAGLMTVWQDRSQRRWSMCEFDPTTGKFKKLWHEVGQQGTPYVELDPSLPRSTAKGAWVSRVEDHLVLITSGEWTHEQKLGGKLFYRRLVSVNEQGKEYVFTANPADRADEIHVYRQTFDRRWGEPTALSKERGLHDGVFAKDHTHYILSSTTPDKLPRSTVHKADGTLIGEIPSVSEEPPVPSVEYLKVGEGEGFFAAVVRPAKFDPKKKYPVIVDVYGGPHHQHVQAAQRNWLIPQWLADQGFVVVAVEGRGTPGRGLKWEYPVYQKFGSIPLEDQVAGLKALGAKFPELDLKRVGMVGWSFGGYMSALGVLKRPDVFRAAVAGAPVTEWEDYDTHYTERYMGLLPESKKAYEESSLLPLADKLERPLLLVHGTADDNVYFRHTLRLTDALFRAGKDFEVLPLPSLTHMRSDPVVTERLWTLTARFFQRHLGKPADAATTER